MMSSPLVTMVVCSYNAGEHLRPAVVSALNQTWTNLEVIVVDDGSTDDSLGSIEVLADRRLRILRQENAGKSVALNRALAEARGDFYAIQDADDESEPLRVELQVRRLLEEPALAAVFCGHDLILDGQIVAPRLCEKGVEECRRDIDAYRMPAHDPTVMFRMSKVRDFKYDPALRIGQGYDYILRVGEQHPMVVLGRALYLYRVHGNSVTRRGAARRQEAVMEVLRRAAARRGDRLMEELVSGVKQSGRNAMRDNNLAAHFIESVLDLRRVGRRREAVEVGFRCAGLHPFDPHYLKALAYSVMPHVILERLKPAAV